MTDDFAPINPDELCLSHCACTAWVDIGLWVNYFGSVQTILNADITHLDKNDPVRRRVKPGALSEIAEYVIAIDKSEGSSCCYGKMETIGIEFSIECHREVQGWPNSIDWYFPAGFNDTSSGLEKIRSLFHYGNIALSPFYAYSDTIREIRKKKKISGSVNLQAELVGVFWLTYLDSHYVSFIGKERFADLEEVDVSFNGGATLSLGVTPTCVSEGLRIRTEIRLAPKLFAEPKNLFTKRTGQFALTFDQLRTL